MRIHPTAWAAVVVIAALGLFCVCLPVLCWRGGVPVDELVKLSSLVVSWPVAIALVALVFLSRFKEAIDSFLRNVRSVSFPGGSVQTQGQAPTGAGESEGKGGALSPKDAEQLNQIVTQLQEQHARVDSDLKGTREALNAAVADLYNWKFAFLNLFYVETTKNVILWFARNSPQTSESFHRVWQAVIPNPYQRDVIISVATQYGMLRQEGANIRITREGYFFLKFIGLIPAVPPE